MALTKNSLLSLAPTIVGVVTSIATIPWYIALLGSERYGVLLSVLVLLTYFGQADFGLGRAVTQRIAATRIAAPEELSSLVWSGLAAAAAVSVLGAALMFAASSIFFGSFFEAPADLQREAQNAAWLFALCIPVMMFSGVCAGALVGLERFGVTATGTLLGNLLAQVLPLVMAVLYSVDIFWVLAASLAGRVIGMIPVAISLWAVFLRAKPVVVARKHLRVLFAFGSWIMITSLVGPLMVISDRVVIGATLGAAAVVAYSVPFTIAQRTVAFPLAIAQALFPRLASQPAAESQALGKISVVVVGQLYAFVVAGLICLAGPLLQLWLGDQLDVRSILVGQIALIGFWTNAIANVPYALIQARGNSRFTAVLHIIELPVYCAMLYGFGIAFGLYGIALAFSLRTLLDCAVLFHKARFVDRQVLGALAGPALVIGASLAASHAAGSTDWIAALGIASAASLALMALCWVQMPGEVKMKLTAQFALLKARH